MSYICMKRIDTFALSCD